MKRRGELRMIQRAVAQAWPVYKAERIKAARLIRETLDDPTATSREILAACRVAIYMDEVSGVEERLILNVEWR